jgi:choline-sulfatase
VLRGQSRRQRPNFLFILADDHAGYVLGADGNKQAETPHLDQFASEGTRFARHHCNAPVCTASRQSFFTGQLPHMSGVTRLPTPLSESKPTLARQFAAAGYKTAVYGKMHFNRAAHPGIHGFDYALTEGELTRAWMKDVQPRPVPDSIAVQPPWHPFKDPARIWLNSEKRPFGRYESDMRSVYQTRLAEQFLEAHRNQPFALWVSLMEPHSPYIFPLEDRNDFKASSFTPPRVGPEDGPQIPLIFRDLTEDDKRGSIAAYYTSVRYLDRSVGRVLESLRRLNLENDTMVVYMADHGYDLGHHGRFEKHCGYDQALSVPLLIRFPGRVRQGVVNDLTEHVDVPATILDMMNVDPLPIQHGQSLRPYLTGRKMDHPRSHIFSEYLDNEEAYIRTNRWKYIYCSGKRKRTDGYLTENPTPGRYQRLYDHTTDNGEFKNLAASQPQVVKEMQGLMLDRFRRTHPEAAHEPQRLGNEDALDWYVRPRDV